MTEFDARATRPEGNPRSLLVFNAGSSSLKFAVYGVEPFNRLAEGAITGLTEPEPRLEFDGRQEVVASGLAPAEAAELIIDRLRASLSLSRHNLLGSAHRVVHGGANFSAPMRISAELPQELRATADLAPLHNPAAFAVMDRVMAMFPGAPLAAIFDTGFFRHLPDVARLYAVPAEWAERYAIRRYGFHGIAHADIAERVRSLRPDGLAPQRMLSLHLGQGCSITALQDGRPLDTSMGFSPLEGLIMGTRPGDLDPGVLLFLLRAGVDAASLEEALNKESGLLGLSDASSDMRRLLTLESSGHTGARRALDAFVYRIRKFVGAYAAVLGGIDLVAFGGGIGERSPEMRARICAGLEWLGARIDAEANRRCVGRDADLSLPDSAIEVRVVAVDEAAYIARVALPLLRGG